VIVSTELFESQIIAQRESNSGNQIIFMIYYPDLLQYRDQFWHPVFGHINNDDDLVPISIHFTVPNFPSSKNIWSKNEINLHKLYCTQFSHMVLYPFFCAFVSFFYSQYKRKGRLGSCNRLGICCCCVQWCWLVAWLITCYQVCMSPMHKPRGPIACVLHVRRDRPWFTCSTPRGRP
jgi:hypothetical protein